MVQSGQSPLDIKNDICAALELNENCYVNLLQGNAQYFDANGGNDVDSISSGGSPLSVSQDHVNMVCAIRARLMQAMTKATAFFENNIELHATVASLKREAESRHEEHAHTVHVLNGRISSLMEVVREQQESLDRQQETLALRGIWSNLLRVAPDGNMRHPSPKHHGAEVAGASEEENDQECTGIKDLNDYAATVITWLSLQCAQEAQRGSAVVSNRVYHQHAGKQVAKSPYNYHIEEKLNGINSVSELVQKVGSLFHSMDAMNRVTEKDNSKMRVKLQEMSAICTALRRERDQQDCELDRWKDALSVLQVDHDFSANQARVFAQENAQLRVSTQAEKANSENWRAKCHEILEAVEKTSEASQSHIEPCSTPNESLEVLVRGNKHNRSSSSSTFFSDQQQQHLFSPYEDNSPGEFIVKPGEIRSLDSYCPLVEQADLITQSPPTPFVADRGEHLWPTAPASRSPEKKTDVIDAVVEKASFQGDELRVEANVPRSSSHGRKSVDPIDPRLLDDSALYKMLLEAEDEIDELRPTEKMTSNRGEEKRSAFLASADLHDAIAIAHEMEVLHGPVDRRKGEVVEASSQMNEGPQAHTQSKSPPQAQFEVSSYSTPNKSPSASKQFSKSLRLKHVSATKSASKGWDSYFTRGTLRDSYSPVESPYDEVLRRHKRSSGASSARNGDGSSSNNGRTKESQSESTAGEMVPISPIPLLSPPEQ